MEPFFAEHAERIGWIPPRGGLTAWPWLRSGESSRPFCEEAAARGVLLAPGDCFGVRSHFRVGLGAGGDTSPRQSTACPRSWQPTTEQSLEPGGALTQRCRPSARARPSTAAVSLAGAWWP